MSARGIARARRRRRGTSCAPTAGALPRRALRAAAVFAGGALVLGASACESTESESARLGREGAKLIAGAGTVGLGGSNRDVRVGRVALVHGGGRLAAAVELTDTSARAQVGVPVLIDVRGAKGASLYRNDVQGIEPSLHEMPLVRAHAHAWWVDDQVLAAGSPSAVKVRVGKPKAGAAGVGVKGAVAAHATSTGSAGSTASAALASRGVELRDLQLGSDVAGPYMTGTAVNRSGVVQRNMPIFAVALRGGRVVAAGRALIPRLAVSAGAHPTVFRIYFVGSPRGARVELTPAPAGGE